MNHPDRRREARQAVPGVWQDGCLRLRAGDGLRLLNTSSHGALIEGPCRLQPGRRLEVHVTTRAGRRLFWSRVVWVRVHRVRADQVEYLAGLEFEHAVEGAWRAYDVPLPGLQSG